MPASLKLNTGSTGSVVLQPASTSATDVTLNLPVVNSGSSLAINGPAFSAYQSSGTSLSNNTYTKVLFDTEDFDTNNNFSSSRFTPTVAGYYQLSASILFASGQTTESVIAVYKNGSLFKLLQDIRATFVASFSGSILVYANGTTDYFEIYCYQSSGGSINTNTASYGTYFNGSMVRAA